MNGAQPLKTQGDFSEQMTGPPAGGASRLQQDKRATVLTHPLIAMRLR